MEIVQTDREVNNLEVQTTALWAQYTSLTVDSAWMNAVRLKNFTGTIYRDGKVEGSADQAELHRSGSKKEQSDQITQQKDSTAIKIDTDQESSNIEKQRKTVADKETKGIQVPWWLWLLGAGGLVLLIITIYNRIKSKLKSF
ncbi:hypothetical protein [Sphingobacterium psychroaquaticum]|nr:hypothetical protein [Sphingobacterium psychroaquaticum]